MDNANNKKLHKDFGACEEKLKKIAYMLQYSILFSLPTHYSVLDVHVRCACAMGSAQVKNYYIYNWLGYFACHCFVDVCLRSPLCREKKV